MLASATLNYHHDNTIHECASIKEAAKYIDINKKLVIFDLDNTVFRPDHVNDVGSDQWFGNLIDHAFKMMHDKELALATALILRNAVHKYIPICPVENDVISLIHMLQKMNMSVIALTARGSTIIDTTEMQLQRLQAQFSNNWPQVNRCFDACRSGSQVPMYQNGVIYCNGLNKGLVLKEFLRQSRTHQDHIIVIDDGKNNLECIKNAMQEMPLKLTLLRYGYLDKHIARFSFDQANASLRFIKKHFSKIERDALKQLQLLPIHLNDGYRLSFLQQPTQHQQWVSHSSETARKNTSILL